MTNVLRYLIQDEIDKKTSICFSHIPNNIFHKILFKQSNYFEYYIINQSASVENLRLLAIVGLYPSSNV